MQDAWSPAPMSCWSRSGCSTSTGGSQVPDGSKSLAYALRLRASDRTLKDTEISGARDAAVARAVRLFGVVQRA